MTSRSPVQRASTAGRRGWLAAAVAAIIVALVVVTGCDRSTPADGEPLRFMALGDFGTGGPAQRQVARQMAATYRDWGADFVLLLGDNFYSRGVKSAEDPLWQSHFESVYDPAGLPIAFHAVAGNHDHKGDAKAQIEYSRRSARWHMPDHHYVFRRQAQDRSVDFFGIDVMVLDAPFGAQPTGLAWLNSALAKSDADHKIVFGHFPIWASLGRYGDHADLVERLAPVLQANNVVLYIAGHEHHLEIQKPRKGLVQAISGAGSQNRDVAPGDAARFVSGRLGFLWFEIGSDGIEARAVSRDGDVLYSTQLAGR
jgi:acid phosphatase